MKTATEPNVELYITTGRGFLKISTIHGKFIQTQESDSISPHRRFLMAGFLLSHVLLHIMFSNRAMACWDSDRILQTEAQLRIVCTDTFLCPCHVISVWWTSTVRERVLMQVLRAWFLIVLQNQIYRFWLSHHKFLYFIPQHYGNIKALTLMIMTRASVAICSSEHPGNILYLSDFWPPWLYLHNSKMLLSF